MLAELGHEADHTTARVLQDEFGDVPRSDEADGRAISFPAFCASSQRSRTSRRSCLVANLPPRES
jgi:hypothetical protein